MANQRTSQQIAQENSTMAEIGRIVSSSLNINEVYPAFSDQVQTLIPFDQLDITVIDRESKEDEVAFSTALTTTSPGFTGSSPLEGTITGKVSSSLTGLIVQGFSPAEVESRYSCLESSVKAGFRSWIAVPLIARDEAIGALFLHSRTDKAFTQLDLDLAGRIANQISGAMANARLYDERKRAEEMERRKSEQLVAMFAVARILARSGSFESKITDVMEELARTADGEVAIIRVPDEQHGGLRRVDSAGPGNLELSGPPIMLYGDNLPTTAFREEQAVIVNDYVTHPMATQQGIDRGVKSLLSVPVKAGGYTLGVVSISALEYNHFTPDRVRLLTAIINGLGTLLFNSQLAQSLESSREEMAAVDEVARIITSNLDIDQVYEKFATKARSLIDFDQASINEIDENQGTLCLRYLTDSPGSRFNQGDSIPLAGSLSGQLADEKRTRIVDLLSEGSGFSRANDFLKEGYRSGIATPLFGKEDVIGSFILFSKQANSYGFREMAVLERLASQIAPAVENSRLYRDLQSNVEEMAAVDKVARIMTANLDISEVYEQFASEVKKLVLSQPNCWQDRDGEA